MDQPSSPPPASTRPRIISRLLPLVLLVAGASVGLWQVQRPRLAAPMSVPAPLRKQVLQGYMAFGSIGWVSNEQVVFHGIPVGPKAGKTSLYLWNLKGKPRLLLKNSPGGCAREKSIRAKQLLVPGKDKIYIFREPDFRPQSSPITTLKGAGVFDPANCSWIPTPERLQDRVWQALRQGEGFLDFGLRYGPATLRIVEHLSVDQRTHQATGIRMPKPMIPMAVHAAHDDSYLVFDLHQSPADEQRWIEANNRDIWRLDQHLQSQKLSIPAGPWVGIGAGTISFLPTRPGVLITSNNFARNGAAGGAGLYLWRPGAAAQRLEKGLVQKAAVSPDGCRLAYGFKPRLDTGIPEGGPRLVVLDLCSRGRDRQRAPEDTE